MIWCFQACGLAVVIIFKVPKFQWILVDLKTANTLSSRARKSAESNLRQIYFIGYQEKKQQTLLLFILVEIFDFVMLLTILWNVKMAVIDCEVYLQ